MIKKYNKMEEEIIRKQKSECAYAFWKENVNF